VVKALGVPNLHFHDLRHTGNTLAADLRVSTRNLMARVGHDNERAALRYQHQSSKADRAIADGLEALLQAERATDDEDGDEGAGGVLVRWPNCTLIARRRSELETIKAQCSGSFLGPGPSLWSG
jgi:hypothetical protein